MTLQITPEALGVLVVGCVVGIAVFRHTARTQSGLPARGDVVGAISAAVGVVAALGLLLGFEHGESGSTSSPEAPTVSSTTTDCPKGSPGC
ncbi:hypothetical protein [Streptomyces sp. NPDC051921]|uniref:hypothetical protein n=1 Tax=Streptomyces sp. NPDC051921 TaxID=3155806 RepID=UPI00341D9819